MKKVISRYNEFGRRLNPNPSPEEKALGINVWVPNLVFRIYRKVARERQERKKK